MKKQNKTRTKDAIEKKISKKNSFTNNLLLEERLKINAEKNKEII